MSLGCVIKGCTCANLPGKLLCAGHHLLGLQIRNIPDSEWDATAEPGNVVDDLLEWLEDQDEAA